MVDSELRDQFENLRGLLNQISNVEDRLADLDYSRAELDEQVEAEELTLDEAKSRLLEIALDRYGSRRKLELLSDSVSSALSQLRYAGRDSLCDELMPGFLSSLAEIPLMLGKQPADHPAALQACMTAWRTYVPVSRRKVGEGVDNAQPPLQDETGGDAELDLTFTDLNLMEAIRKHPGLLTIQKIAVQAGCAFGTARNRLPGLLAAELIVKSPTGYALTREGKLIIDEKRPERS